jgi:hypothetical protein
MINASNIVASEAEDVVEPVTLAEVKEWLTIDFADFDDLLTSMISGARKTIENFIGAHLVEKSVTMDVELAKDENIILPYSLAVGDLEVIELDSDDTEETLITGDDFYPRGNLIRGLGEGRYIISYTSVPDVPADLKEAIKMEVAERFAHRGENDSTTGLSAAAKEKAQPYRLEWL